MSFVPVKKKARIIEAALNPKGCPAHAVGSAVRAVLTNVELVQRILNQVDDATTFALIARTSKALFRPSAGQLWHSLDGDTLQTLLRLLPSRLSPTTRLETAEAVHPRLGNAPGGVLRKGDVERWNIYAPLIQQIELGSASDAVVGRALTSLRTLIGFLPGTALLPNLKTITFSYSSAYIQIAQLLLSPSLRRVRISVALMTAKHPPISTPLVTSFLEWLPDRAPHLTHLHMEEGDLTPDVVGEICQCLKKMPQLEDITIACTTRQKVPSLGNAMTIDCIPTAHEIMKAVAGLASLQHLSVKEWASEDSNKNLILRACILPDDYPRHTFKKLKSLQITAPIAFCVRFIQRCSPPLRSFHITCHAPHHKWSAYFVTVIRRCCRDLRDLDITLNDWGKLSQWTVFRPMLKLPLIAFAITSLNDAKGFQLDDNDMLAIAKAWPDIQSLHLNIKSPQVREGDPCITFSGLLHLARHCRALHHLKIAYLGNSQMDGTEDALRLNELQHLHIGQSAEPAVRLAKFIVAVAPNAIVTGLEQSVKGGRVLRDELNDILSVVSTARRFDKGATALVI